MEACLNNKKVWLRCNTYKAMFLGKRLTFHKAITLPRKTTQLPLTPPQGFPSFQLMVVVPVSGLMSIMASLDLFTLVPALWLLK